MFNFATISSHTGVRNTLALQFINKGVSTSVEAVERERMKNGHTNVQAFKSDIPLSPEDWRAELERRGVDMSSIPTAGGRGAGRIYEEGDYQMAASSSRNTGPRLISVNTMPLRAKTPFEYLTEDIAQASAQIQAFKLQITTYEEYVLKLSEAIPQHERYIQTLRDRLESLTEADGKPAPVVEQEVVMATDPATNAEISAQELAALEAEWRLTDEGKRKRVGRHYETEAKWHDRFIAAAQPNVSEEAPVEAAAETVAEEAAA